MKQKELTIETKNTNNKPAIPCPKPVTEAEKEQFHQLVERHRPLLRQLARLYRQTAEDREDLESEAVLAAWKSFADFSPNRGTFGTWIGAILRSEATDIARREARRPRCLPNTNATELLLENTVDRHCRDSESEEEILVWLSELPPRLRRVLELVKIDGLSCEEAGSRLGSNAASVRTQVWKARKLMRKRGHALLYWN